MILTTAEVRRRVGRSSPAAGAHDYVKDAIVSVTAAPARGFIFYY